MLRRGDHDRVFDARRFAEDRRGEALPAAILFLGVMLTILLEIHVVIVAMARTVILARLAHSAFAAAQTDGDPEIANDGFRRSARESDGILGARFAMAGCKSSIIETRPPAVIVER